MTRCVALVPAAGRGSRLGAGLPKQYRPVAGLPLIQHALRTLAAHPRIDHVYVVLAPDDAGFVTLRWESEPAKIIPLRVGGATRAASVLNGLRAMQHEVAADDWVLVHDAARPCLTLRHLDRLIAALEYDAVGGILAVPVADTLKRADREARIVATEPREGLWQAQTPQMFRHGTLMQALTAAGTESPTDEAGAVEYLGLRPKLIESDATNLKVTYPQDIRLAELILRHPEASE